MNGFLTPNDIDKYLASAPKFLSKAQVIFTIEASGQDIENMNVTSMQPEQKALSTFIPEGVNVTSTISVINQFNTAIAPYLNISNTRQADVVVSPNIAIFSNRSIILPPSGSNVPNPTTSDFKLFINGQFVEPIAINSVSQQGNNVVATFNTGSLDFGIKGTDIITINGKIS